MLGCTPTLNPRTLVLCFDGTSNEYDADVRCFYSIPSLRYPYFVLSARTQMSWSSSPFSVRTISMSKYAITRYYLDQLVRGSVYLKDIIGRRRNLFPAWCGISAVRVGSQSPRSCIRLVSNSFFSSRNIYVDWNNNRYLDAHVMDGYQFLMQNYRAGDKICLFGSCYYVVASLCDSYTTFQDFLGERTQPGH